jgi:aminoglycoside 2'-N-acetyltransferase I
MQGRASFNLPLRFLWMPLMNEKQDALDIEVKAGRDLSQDEYSEILALCTQAFRRDYSPYLNAFQNATHVLGRHRHKLVSHVLWITRWLQIGTSPILRTAYVEALATDLSHRNQGFASEIMRKIAVEIQDYDIGALSTGSPGFYARLGWQSWRGNLFIRTDKGLIPTRDEHGVMVLPFPETPPIDLDAPLSVEWREIEPW